MTLATWLTDSQLDAKALLRAIFGWRRSNVVTHLDHAEQADINDGATVQSVGWGYIQHRAYKRAANVFERCLRNTPPVDISRADLLLGAAFSLWRLGRCKEARETLYPLVRNHISEAITANERVMESNANACRVYLEVSRDLLLFLPVHRRLREADRWDLALISSKLLDLLDNLPNASAQDRMLAHIAVRHVAWLLGKQVSLKEIQMEFAACLHSKYPTAAWAAVVHLIQMSLPDGIRAWRMLHGRLKEAHREDYLKKNYESLLVGLAAKVLPHVGLFFPELAYVILRVAYGLRTERTEFRFSRQLAKWETWQEEWKKTGIVHAELE